MKRILIYDWNAGFKKISFTNFIRRETGYSLSRGKGVTDSVLRGQSFSIQIHDEDLDHIVAELKDIGVKFSVESGSPLCSCANN